MFPSLPNRASDAGPNCRGRAAGEGTNRGVNDGWDELVDANQQIERALRAGKDDRLEQAREAMVILRRAISLLEQEHSDRMKRTWQQCSRMEEWK